MFNVVLTGPALLLNKSLKPKIWLSTILINNKTAFI